MSCCFQVFYLSFLCHILCRFIERFSKCVVQISGYIDLIDLLGKKTKIIFSCDNAEHEKKLLQVPTFQSLLYCILKTSKLFVSVLISLMEDTPAPDQISAKSMKISLLGNISCKCESGYFFTSSNLLHLLTQFIFKGMRVKCEEIGCDNVDVGKVLRIQKI